VHSSLAFTAEEKTELLPRRAIFSGKSGLRK